MCHLRALEKKGLLTREAHLSRAIQLSPEAEAEQIGLPLAGRVSAGVMHEAIEQEDRIDFGQLFTKKSQFVLEVTGDSMADAHIADDDYVVLTKRRTASPGDMVVAQTEDGETTVRYWHSWKSRKRIRLQPANSKMEPTCVKEAKLIGIVSGVVRKLR